MRDLKMKGLSRSPDKKRIQLDIDLKIFDGIRRITQMRYCTVTTWVTRAIVEKLIRDEKFLK
jgi:hypothetical protein